MFGKNNKYMRDLKQREKVTYYGIRKFSVGVVSVALSSLFLLGYANSAAASSTVATDVQHSEKAKIKVDADTNKEKAGKVDKNSLADSAPKKEEAETKAKSKVKAKINEIIHDKKQVDKVLASVKSAKNGQAVVYQDRSGDAVSNPEWLKKPNILELQRYRGVNDQGKKKPVGSDNVGEWNDVTLKTDMYAHVEERNGSKYLVFDVFFNNDGRSMLKHSNQQQYVWQIPYQIADLNNGGYKGDTLSNLSIDFYDKNASSAYNAVLSRDFSNFYKNNANSAKLNPLQTDHSFGQSIYLYTLGVRAGRSRNQDLSDTFHSNKDDQTIKNATKLSAPYSSYSYGIGVRTTAVNEAAHLHCDVKLRPGVTTEDIQNAYTWANTSSYGRTTNSAYTFISGREPYGEENLPRKKSDSEAPKLYLNGQPMTDGKEFTTYQGESTPLKFEASDNEGKLKNFKVTGMPSGDFSVDNQSATESAKYSKDYSQEKFENKVNGQPKEKIYDIAVTATDEAGNTTSHSVKVQLKNQSSKYAAPTADVITVKRGEKPSNNDIFAKLKYNKADDKKGTPSVVSIPDTNLAPDAFKTGDTADAGSAVVKVTYSDGSYHTVNVPVKVKKPDNLANTLTGKTVEVKVGDSLKQTADKKVDAKQYVTTTGNVQPQKVEFEKEPRTDLAGTFKRKAIATYPDGSKNETDVTFKVKPLKPVIQTNLIGHANQENQKVTVSVGDGVPDGAIVRLTDDKNKVLGEGQVNNGSAEVVIKDKMPDNTKVKATTIVKNGGEITSDPSDPSNVSQDDVAPTLTVSAPSEITAGDDLTFTFDAKDNVKVNFEIATGIASGMFDMGNLMNILSTQQKTTYSSYQDDHMKGTTTLLSVPDSEVGKHEFTFKVTDDANHTVTKKVSVTVYPKLKLNVEPITVPLGGTLPDAKVALGNTEGIAEVKNKTTGKVDIPAPTIQWVEQPKTDKVGNALPGKVRITFNDNRNGGKPVDVSVPVNVQDQNAPEIKVYKKENGNYVEITAKDKDGYIKLDSYAREDVDFKITSTDNSGQINDLSMMPIPGVKSSKPDGTGSKDNPKSFTLTGQAPLGDKYSRVVKAVDPSGNTTTLKVRLYPHNQSEKYGNKVHGKLLTYKMSDGNNYPDPKDGISQEGNDFPVGSTYSWATEPKWTDPTSGKDGKGTPKEVSICVTLPDGSTKNVKSTLTIIDDVPPVIEEPEDAEAITKDNHTVYRVKVVRGGETKISLKLHDTSGQLQGVTATGTSFVTAGQISKITDATIDNPATVDLTVKAPNQAAEEGKPWQETVTLTDAKGNTTTATLELYADKDADLYDPTVTPVVKTNTTDTVTQDDIKKAVTKDKEYPNNYADPTVAVDGKIEDYNKDNKKDYFVPVTVTYPDQSKDHVQVHVTIGNDTLAAKCEATKGRISVAYGTSKDTIKNKVENTSENEVKVKEGRKKVKKTDYTVQVLEESSLPDGKTAGQFEVPVKVVYKDGSADTTTVKVTVEQPQSKSDVSQSIGQVEKEYGQATQENDVLKVIKQDDGPKVSSHIKAKTIVPGQTLPDGKHPGTQKVRVQLTFDDGSHKVVEVPVITKDPLNKQYEPVATELKKDYGQPATNEEIIKQVTVKKGPQVSEVVPNKDVTKIEVVPGQTAIDGKQPGTVKVQVKVTYKDGTSDIVNVPVTVADPASVTYPPKADALTVPWGTKQDDIKNQIVSKVTIDSKYPTDKTKPKIEVAKNANVPDGQTSTKVNVPVEVTYPDGSVAIVQVPVTVGNKQADNYDPTVTPIKKTYAERKITADDIKKAVTINGLDPNKGDYTISVDDTIPADGFAEGHTDVAVTIKYKDGSTEKTKVPVIIGQSEAGYTEKNLPQAKTIYKNYGEEIKDSEITGAVSVPNYTKSDKQTPGDANKLQFTIAEGSAKPDSHKSGKTLVKVVVTYEDGSKATVDVPVIVKAPDTEQYTPAATPVEKEFGKQTSEDDIKKAITISGYPEDKKNKIQYKVSTNKIPNGQTAGDFTVPVEITYADGSKGNIDVPVKVKSPKPQTTDNTVFVGTSPDAENSISNKDQYPKNTTFEWEKTPDTSKAGEPTGNILIHIPGQKDPLKAPDVKVKVVAVPETQSINVFEGETPEASKGIKSKEGQTTTAEWQKDSAGVAQIPDTSTAGTVKGKVVVKVPSVQTPATVEVTVNVLPAPKGGTINTNVNGSVDPKSGVKGNDKYPNDTKFVWKDGNPDLTKPGIVTKKVTVTVPGMKAKEVEVTINVLPNPAGQDQVTLQGQTPDPKKSVADHDKYPKGTTFNWTKEPSTDNPGETAGKVEITVPGSDKPITVDAKLKVIPYPTKQHRVVLQDPEGKTPLNAKDSIKNADQLPSDPNNATTFTWKDGKAPDNKVPGNKNGVVLVKIPGVDKEIEVPTTIEVVPKPNANDGIKVAKGGDPKPEDSIANIGDLPSGTTFKWKKDHKPNTENPAEKVPGVVEVTIPGIDHPIEVPVNVVVTDKPFINDGAATNDSGDKNKTEITGKSLPGTKIEVQDETGKKIGEGVTDQEGKFKIAVTPKQAAGKQLKLIPTNNNQTGDATTVTVTEKPAKPTIDTPENGSVTIKPADNANNVSIDVDMVPNTVNEVIDENEPQPKQTIAAHKDKDGKWKLDGDVPTGVTIDPETGAITIPAEAVKDGSPISAIAKNKDGQSSDPAKGTVGFIKPQIINQSANNDDTKNKTIVTGKTLPGAVVKIVGPNGHEFTDSKTPVKADKDGNFTVEIPKQEQGTLLTITPINGPKAGTPVNVAVGISITDQKAKNTSDKPDKTVVSGETAPNAKVTITDTDGNPIKDKSGQPVSVTADDKGHFTVDIPKQADGTDIVLTPSLKNGDKPNLVGEPVNATVKDTPVVKDGNAINDPKTPAKTVVSGKTTPKAQVEVKDKDGKTIGTGTADENGHFTIPVPKQDPDTKLTLVPTANGVTGEPAEVTVKDVPVVNEGTAHNDPKTPAKTVVSGKTTPKAKVEVKDKDGKTIGTGTADENGHFTIQVPKQDPDTKLTLVPTANGVTGEPAEVTVKDVPVVSEGTANNDPKTPDKTVVSGKTTPKAQVEVKDKDGNTIGTGTADDQGKFTIQVPKQNPDTKLTLVPTANGVTGEPAEVTVKDVPVVNEGTANNDPKTPDKTVVSGKTTPKAKVEVKDKSGNKVGEGTADENGHFTIQVPKQNPDTKLTLVPTANGVTGEPAEVTVKDVPVVSEGTANNDPKTPAKTVVSGKTTPKAQVEVKDKDGKTIGTGTADDQGNFTVAVPKQDPDTKLTLIPTANGVTGEPAEVIVKDVPVVNEGIAYNDPKMPDKTVVSGKTTPKAKVEVKDKDGKTIGTGTADDQGNFTVAVPKQDPDTKLTLIPTANGVTGEPAEVTVKDVPVVNDGTANNDPKTPDKTVVSGKTTPKAQVEVKDKDGKTIGTGTADDQGNFTVAVPKQDPDTKLTLIPTANGVTGEPAEVTVKDVPVVNDGTANNDPKTPDKTVVSGKTTPKAQVEVKDKDGKTIGTGTADDQGKFTIQVPKQDPDTKLTLIPTANGVTGEPTEVTVKDVPVVNEGTAHNDPKTPDKTVVSGKTTPKAQVEVKDKDGKTIGTGTADDQGHFAISVPKQDPDTKLTLVPTANGVTGEPAEVTVKDVPVVSGNSTIESINEIPVIIDGKAINHENGSAKTVVSGKTTPKAQVEVKDKDGKTIGTGTADDQGNFTVAVPKQDPDTKLTLIPTANGVTGESSEVTVKDDIVNNVKIKSSKSVDNTKASDTHIRSDKATAHELPQTGNNSFALTGLLLAGIAAMLGISGYRRKNKD
ncbi:Ig-like domain-containing protein [Lactobacillus iners]|uniref:Gram-positive signal peptide protein, YSIRK family n=1 Tax=Lactobacillus iners DSM 13335 TaxID=525328 RepID=C8PC75_9LACO|nr:Ig-like domain-containing protein [Lactobacillus iners]EEW51908.1 Gram-positive signal peptide protein, YSIRK family [Lactobacillus iners DSM 13335]QFZ99649.1 YSIRK-type signal peptide-containing protein [Lactobacillus iners]QGA00774.1 YSIRK-type signal peptide-containing protein [Lactobacillus iners]